MVYLISPGGSLGGWLVRSDAEFELLCSERSYCLGKVRRLRDDKKDG